MKCDVIISSRWSSSEAEHGEPAGASVMFKYGRQDHGHEGLCCGDNGPVHITDYWAYDSSKYPFYSQRPTVCSVSATINQLMLTPANTHLTHLTHLSATNRRVLAPVTLLPPVGDQLMDRDVVPAPLLCCCVTPPSSTQPDGAQAA